MSFFDRPVDRRELAYGKLAFSTLEMLRDAVARREAEGETRAEIARRIGVDRSQLSRTLNGRVKNITLRTISDILFATGHSVNQLEALPWEIATQAWDRYGPRSISADTILVPTKSINSLQTKKAAAGGYHLSLPSSITRKIDVLSGIQIKVFAQ